jgi:hypothetical protein
VEHGAHFLILYYPRVPHTVFQQFNNYLATPVNHAGFFFRTLAREVGGGGGCEPYAKDVPLERAADLRPVQRRPHAQVLRCTH